MSTVRRVVLTAPAAAGKSFISAIAVDLLQRRHVPATLISDHVEFFKVKEEDAEHRHHVHPFGDARFRHVGSHLFDESIRRVAQQADAVQAQGRLSLVEIGRGAQSPTCDISYGRALELFGRDLWEPALVLYVDTPWELRRQRNLGRLEQGNGTPDDVMEELYRSDDVERLEQEGIEVRRLDGTASREELTETVSELLP